MGVLIELRNKTKELGQKIIMMNPRPNIRKLLALTGVDKIIEIWTILLIKQIKKGKKNGIV